MPRQTALLVVSVVLALSTSSAFGQGAQTHSGRAEPGFLYTYAFTPAAPGQLLATLAWDADAAHLALILVCTVDGEELGFGVASGLLDRFARLEAGVLPSHPCEIGVLTVTSSASYTLNLQRSQPEMSSAQPPESASVTRSLVKTVIPGTSRGTTMERTAFRLQQAVMP